MTKAENNEKLAFVTLVFKKVKLHKFRQITPSAFKKNIGISKKNSPKYLNQVAFRGGQWDWDTNPWEARDLAKYRPMGFLSPMRPITNSVDLLPVRILSAEGGSKFFKVKLQNCSDPRIYYITKPHKFPLANVKNFHAQKFRNPGTVSWNSSFKQPQEFWL